jgi:exonuclease III
MNKIKIFTQNLYGVDFIKKNQRMNEIEEYIYYKKFDFVFLQEAVFISDVKKIAQNNFSYYVRGRFGPKGGLTIISKKELDKIEFYKFKAQGAIFSLQITDRLIEKGFLVGYLGNTVYMNTHLLSTYGRQSGNNVKSLNKQFEQLFDFVKEKIKEGKKIIVGGDFNFNPNSKNYKEITKILNDETIPPKLKIDQEIPPKLKIKPKYDSEQIDFIFSSKKKCKNYKEPIYPIFVSDHPGIGIELLS